MGHGIGGQRAGVDRARRLAKTHLAGPPGRLDGKRAASTGAGAEASPRRKRRAGALAFWWGFFAPLMTLSHWRGRVVDSSAPSAEVSALAQTIGGIAFPATRLVEQRTGKCPLLVHCPVQPL